MISNSKLAEWRRRALVGASLVALLSNNLNAYGQNAKTNRADHLKTATPIKHVIVLIWREPHLLSPLGYLCATKGRNGFTPVVQTTRTVRRAQISRKRRSSKRLRHSAPSQPR